MDSVERRRNHKAETWYPEQKFMFTIIWNRHGFHVVDKLPNDTKMNIDYFVTKILSLFE
jgi:hypothetical protein